MLWDCFPIKYFIAIDTVEKCLMSTKRAERSEPWSDWEVFFKPKWYSEGFIKQWDEHVNLVPRNPSLRVLGLTSTILPLHLAFQLYFQLLFWIKKNSCRKALSEMEVKIFYCTMELAKLHEKKGVISLSLENHFWMLISQQSSFREMD